jgi:hypothetical protein
MSADRVDPVAVTRRIHAPAHAVFLLLATPSRHLKIDGSAMLRGSDDGGTLEAIATSSSCACTTSSSATTS